MSLYKYLWIICDYKEDEALETCLRYYNNMPIPENIMKDIDKYNISPYQYI